MRDATHKQIMGNEEMKNLIDILGLKFGMEYQESNIKTLRYGKLMIMADQDTDGSHIKGLVINFIHHFWPTLLDVPGFLQQFITPIVKATKGKKSITFFTLPQYENWRESTGNDAKGYKIKYYKGLGTSTSSEAKEYFSNLDLHEVTFDTLSNDKVTIMSTDEYDSDGMDFEDQRAPKETTGSDMIDMIFSKKRVEDRKLWLGTFQKDTYLDYSEARENGVTYSDFVNREFIHYSQYDNQRSIPHVMDGFKPSQRKVLFACFKRKLKGEIKVAQLAGYVSFRSVQFVTLTTSGSQFSLLCTYTLQLHWRAFRLSPWRGLTERSHCRYGPELLWIEQRELVDTSRTIWYAPYGRKGPRLDSLHLHKARESHAYDLSPGRRRASRLFE